MRIIWARLSQKERVSMIFGTDLPSRRMEGFVMERYVKSHWLHEYMDDSQTDDTIAILHAKNLDVIHIDHQAWELINQFQEPKLVNTYLEGVADHAQVKGIIDQLIEREFLVPEHVNEIENFHNMKNESIDKQGAGKIASLRILLTEQCNLRCTYCFIDHKATYMEKQTLYDVLEKLIESSNKYFVDIQFFGGEPLLKFDLIKEAVEYMSNVKREGKIKHVGYNITTNATFVTDEMASFFAQHNFNISVSLDGPKELNDKNRIYMQGAGSYDRAIAGFRKLKEHGCDDVGILLTPTPTNVHQIADFYEYSVRELDVNFFAINTPQPSLYGWGVDGKEYAEQTIRSHELSLEYDVPFSSTLTKVLIALNSKKGPTSSCFNPQGDRCASVTTDGQISPCIVDWNKEFLQPLDKLDSPDVFLTESFVEQDNECMSCPAVNICGGPCHLENFFMIKGGKWDKERCRYFEETVEWAVWNMDKVLETV